MRIIPITCLLAVLLSGCGSSTGSARPNAPDVLRWGVVGVSDVRTLDPALALDATTISFASLIYGGLVRLDEHLRVRPDGAARWSISPNGKVYTFVLRRHLRYANGQPVTASDFAAALQRSLGPDGSGGAASSYLGLIEGASSHPGRGIKVVDASTLRIRLIHPAAHFLAELAFPASFVPEPDLITRYGLNWTDHAAGFGPFFVRSWDHSGYLTLERNPFYYGGKPALRQINVQFFQQPQDGVAAYDRNKLDLVSGLQAGASLASRPPGTRQVAGLALDYLAFNTKRLPFYRLNARRAFASAWTQSLVAGSMGDSAFASRSFLPSAFGIPIAPWHATASGSTYLKRARYPNARRFPAVTLILPRDAHVHALASALSLRWIKQLGVNVVVRQLSLSDYARVLNAHAFDLAIVRWGADYPDLQDFLGTQLGSSPDNLTGWIPKNYQSDITLADSYSPSDPRRIALFQHAGALAASKLPILPLDEPALSAMISPNLRNISLTPLGTITGAWAHAKFTA